MTSDERLEAVVRDLKVIEADLVKHIAKPQDRIDGITQSRRLAEKHWDDFQAEMQAEKDKQTTPTPTPPHK